MDKYFGEMRTPEEKKMTEAVKAMRGRGFLWWFRWSLRHPEANWETFSWTLLWYFKPEFRDVLPIPDDEGQLDLESDGGTSRDVNHVGNCVQTEAKHKREGTTTNSVDEMKERLQNEATTFTDCIIPMSKGHNESVIEFEGIVDATTEKQRSEKKSRSTFTLEDGTLLKEKPPKESLQILGFPPPKPPDAESRVVTSPPPPKPPEWFITEAARCRTPIILCRQFYDRDRRLSHQI
jgi:hypothetical protein